jgi:hypothetical protein
MTERFKDQAVSTEVARLVRSEPEKAADVPEALDFFIGGHLSSKSRAQLKVWDFQA